MTEADEQKLIVGVTVIRTLTGGLNRSIDWVLVARLFPHLDQAILNKRWPPLGQKYKAQLEKLQSDFQEAFIAAYRESVVPPIDYDNLMDYDWQWLVGWAEQQLDIPR